MVRAYRLPAILAALAASIILLTVAIDGRFRYPYSLRPFSGDTRHAALEMAASLGGLHRLAADIGWIQLVQYYGTPETPLDRETEFNVSWQMTNLFFGIPVPRFKSEGGEGKENHSGCDHEHDHCLYHGNYEGGHYPELLARSLRITDIDPFFSYAYLYGAGALAWNLERPDEAVSLLEKGIGETKLYDASSFSDFRQPFWQYHLYISAIIYKKSGAFEKMTTILETAARQPNCPNMVKAILASIYQKENRCMQALRLWVEVYDSHDPMYRVKSEQKIGELKNILHL